LAKLKTEPVNEEPIELWVPWSEDVKSYDGGGEEEGIPLHDHQHPSTSSLKRICINTLVR
jgi:hypothetical protein